MMRRLKWRPLASLLLVAGAAHAQGPLTWEQVRERFRVNNPSLAGSRLLVDEARAFEITAYLRPNQEVTATLDQLDPFTPAPYRPLGNTLPLISGSYLHERQHKRELRRDSARKATDVAEANLADQERTLLFNLRNAFVQTLQAKAVLALTREDLDYYDRALGVNRQRQRAGDISQVDLDRLELQRVQFQTDVLTAEVNLRTAKIQLLTLLNDRTPVDGFDVTGTFDFVERVAPLEEFRAAALEARPDLKAAAEALEKSKVDHRLAIANGSVDPTFGVDGGRNPPIPAYFGFSVTVPLRIFDRNQGEKLRTQIDITRNERLRQAVESQVFGDVDSAYAMLTNDLALLRPYKTEYLQRAVKVRETVSFAYQRGGASLLDFLQAQKDYRSIELNYLNLIGAYLTAANQLNLAVGKEVMP
jgi:cobalt-zinc-cadmium efflux system outer membrane protein